MIGNVYGFGSIKSRRYCNSNKKHDCVQRNANVCFCAYQTLLLCKTCEGGNWSIPSIILISKLVWKISTLSTISMWIDMTIEYWGS